MPRPTDLWLVTGGAGFIGSAILRRLIAEGRRTRILDDFSSGNRARLSRIAASAQADGRPVPEVIEGSITDPAACASAVTGASHILHLAAIASVPASIEDPCRSHQVNETGFVTLMDAAHRAGTGRVVFASSAAVYGDGPDPAKRETSGIELLSPYALAKHANELHAAQFARHHGLRSVALRFFNIYGPGQDPRSAYSGVISRWLSAMAAGRMTGIHGDGQSIRDFCHVEDVARATIAAALAPDLPARGEAYNIGTGRGVTVTALHTLMREAARRAGLPPGTEPEHLPARSGEVRHSVADISRAREAFGFTAEVELAEGLECLFAWHLGGGDGRPQD